MRSDEIVGDRANAVDLIEKDGVVITIERGAGLRQDRGVFFDAEMFRRVFGAAQGPMVSQARPQSRLNRSDRMRRIDWSCPSLREVVGAHSLNQTAR